MCCLEELILVRRRKTFKSDVQDIFFTQRPKSSGYRKLMYFTKDPNNLCILLLSGVPSHGRSRVMKQLMHCDKTYYKTRNSKITKKYTPGVNHKHFFLALKDKEYFSKWKWRIYISGEERCGTFSKEDRSLLHKACWKDDRSWNKA